LPEVDNSVYGLIRTTYIFTHASLSPMRIRTAATHKAIDKWKERMSSEASRFYVSTAAVLASFLSLPRLGRFALALALVLGAVVNFALSEFALLALLGFFVAKLHCYRLVNSFLRFMPAGQ
jgi:hypothetical protein